MKNNYFFLLLTTLVGFSFNALAGPGGPGHDHGESQTQFQGSNAPKRFADGSVYLPKLGQRQLGIRTTVTQLGEFPRSIELSGKIIHNPNYGGKVQAMIAGRITPPTKGFPIPGQYVKQGELLAYITPEIGPAHSRSLAESRLKRLQALSDTVPRKVLEEAQAAVANEELRVSKTERVFVVIGVFARAQGGDGDVPGSAHGPGPAPCPAPSARPWPATGSGWRATGSSNSSGTAGAARHSGWSRQ